MKSSQREAILTCLEGVSYFGQIPLTELHTAAILACFEALPAERAGAVFGQTIHDIDGLLAHKPSGHGVGMLCYEDEATYSFLNHGDDEPYAEWRASFTLLAAILHSAGYQPKIVMVRLTDWMRFCEVHDCASDQVDLESFARWVEQPEPRKKISSRKPTTKPQA